MVAALTGVNDRMFDSCHMIPPSAAFLFWLSAVKAFSLAKDSECSIQYRERCFIRSGAVVEWLEVLCCRR